MRVSVKFCTTSDVLREQIDDDGAVYGAVPELSCGPCSLESCAGQRD